MYECCSVLIFFEGLDCFGSKESRNDDLGRGEVVFSLDKAG